MPVGAGAATGRHRDAFVASTKFSGAAPGPAAGGLVLISLLHFHAGRPHAAPGLLLQPSPERLL